MCALLETWRCETFELPILERRCSVPPRDSAGNSESLPRLLFLSATPNLQQLRKVQAGLRFSIRRRRRGYRPFVLSRVLAQPSETLHWTSRPCNASVPSRTSSELRRRLGTPPSERRRRLWSPSSPNPRLLGVLLSESLRRRQSQLSDHRRPLGVPPRESRRRLGLHPPWCEIRKPSC